MKFSIITPTRNRRELLPRAIASVQAQSFQDWEHVILDNGDDQVADLVPDDPRYRYVWVPPDERGSLHEMFNRAMSEARGEIVHSLSDDDELTVDALKLAAEHFQDRWWLVGKTAIIDRTRKVTAVRGGNQASLDRTLAGEYWLGGAVYWRRQLTEIVGAFNPDFDGAADFDLFLRFAKFSPPALVDEWMYVYLDHSGTDSRVRAANQAQQSARIAALHRGGT